MSTKQTIEAYHYTVDYEADVITFDVNERQYKLEKQVFLAQGVNIENITSYKEYGRYKYMFWKQCYAVFMAQVRCSKPKTIVGKLEKSLILRDSKKIEKYSKLYDRKKSLGLELVK